MQEFRAEPDNCLQWQLQDLLSFLVHYPAGATAASRAFDHEGLDISELIEPFLKHEISGAKFFKVSKESDFADYGITKVGLRLNLMRYVKKFSQNLQKQREVIQEASKADEDADKEEVKEEKEPHSVIKWAWSLVGYGKAKENTERDDIECPAEEPVATETEEFHDFEEGCLATDQIEEDTKKADKSSVTSERKSGSNSEARNKDILIPKHPSSTKDAEIPKRSLSL